MKTQPTLLVTGANGHLGRAVLSHLLDTLQTPPQHVVAATRHPDSLSAFAQRGVSVRRCDFDRPDSMAEAFQGVDRMLLISTDALDRLGRRLEQHRAAIAAADQAGVRHVVYTSMPKPENSPLLLAPDHVGTEQALAESALQGWTVLRNHWYFENLFMSLPHVLATGQWHTASGEGRVAHIARDDLARAAAVALADTTSEKRIYTLSGAKSYTTSEIAALAGDAAGKAIEVIPVPVEAIEQGMVQAGFPAPLARIFASFDTNTAAGRVAEITGDFKTVTGVDPQSFENWLSEQREALRRMAV